MISPPSDWTRHFGAHLVSLYPPKPGGGRIRYYERITPIRPFSQILRYVLDRDPDFRSQAIVAPREFISCEGEYGAWTRVNGSRQGAPATRYVGAIFADDYAVAIDALVVIRERAPLIEHTAQDLLVKARLGRGVCHRRFRYIPPVDWQAIPSGLVANWYPPDFPNNNTNIVVFPAQPLENTAAEEFEAMLASERARGVEVEGDVAETSIETRSGLIGQRWSLACRQHGRDELLHREIVSFSEPPYAYTIRMESLMTDRLDEHRALLTMMARSVEPIPRPATRTIGPATSESTAGAFGHWLD